MMRSSSCCLSDRPLATECSNAELVFLRNRVTLMAGWITLLGCHHDPVASLSTECGWIKFGSHLIWRYPARIPGNDRSSSSVGQCSPNGEISIRPTSSSAADSSRGMSNSRWIHGTGLRRRIASRRLDAGMYGRILSPIAHVLRTIVVDRNRRRTNQP